MQRGAQDASIRVRLHRRSFPLLPHRDNSNLRRRRPNGFSVNTSRSNAGRAEPIAHRSAIIHAGELSLRSQRFPIEFETPALVLQLDGDQIPHCLIPVASFVQGSPGASGIVREHLLSRRSKRQRSSREELCNRNLPRCPLGKRPLNRLKRSETVSSLQTNKQKLAPPWSHHEIEQVRLLILEGKSLYAVSRRLGRTPQAVRKMASRLKLPLRSLHLMN